MVARNFAKQDGRCSRSPLHASHIIHQCHHQPLVPVTDDKTAGSAETRSYFNDADPLTLGKTKRTILPRQIQNKSEADGPADTRGHSINRHQISDRQGCRRLRWLCLFRDRCCLETGGRPSCRSTGCVDINYRRTCTGLATTGARKVGRSASGASKMAQDPNIE